MVKPPIPASAVKDRAKAEQYFAIVEDEGAYQSTSLEKRRGIESGVASGKIELPTNWLVKINPKTGCHEWQGYRNAKAGYGACNLRGVQLMAHRLAYAFNFKKPPGDRFVCHTCDNPPCVNPEHLFLGTAMDNFKDAVGKGRIRKDGYKFTSFVEPA